MSSARDEGSDGSKLDFSKFKLKPSLDIEYNDQYKASKITFKFVAFKTPKQINRSISMPNRVFFTTKFYTFKQSKTEQVLLRLPKLLAKNMKEQSNMQAAVA